MARRRHCATSIADHITQKRPGQIDDPRVTQFPAYERRSDRNNRFRTFDTCHWPPRAVRAPWLFKAAASPRRSITPEARSASIIGMTFAANVSASSINPDHWPAPPLHSCGCGFCALPFWCSQG